MSPLRFLLVAEFLTLSSFGGQDMSVIRWEEPPPVGACRTGRPKQLIAHELIAFQLKRKPGEWGVVLESRSLSTLAVQISQGRYAPYRPAGSFEATTRIVDDIHVIYARYVGTGDRS